MAPCSSRLKVALHSSEQEELEVYRPMPRGKQESDPENQLSLVPTGYRPLFFPNVYSFLFLGELTCSKVIFDSLFPLLRAASENRKALFLGLAHTCSLHLHPSEPMPTCQDQGVPIPGSHDDTGLSESRKAGLGHQHFLWDTDMVGFSFPASVAGHLNR